jgi:hypothetical protein
LWRTQKANAETIKNNTKHHKKKRISKLRRTKKETLREYHQRTLSGKNQDLHDVEEFGDPLHAKQEHTLRIGLHNLFNLSQDKRTSKSRQLITYIIQKSFDVFLMTEDGLCWRKLDNENQWHERILGKFCSSRSMFAYNVTELTTSKALQPGGVGIVATDEVAHRVTCSGKDPTGLGRWTWMQLQGENGIRTRVISVYRPCDSPGPQTVNQQQARYLRTHARDTEPRQAQYDDLFTEAQ